MSPKNMTAPVFKRKKRNKKTSTTNYNHNLIQEGDISLAPCKKVYSLNYWIALENKNLLTIHPTTTI